jgi:hypothetical protein
MLVTDIIAELVEDKENIQSKNMEVSSSDMSLTINLN